jgi:hypothetical protein
MYGVSSSFFSFSRPHLMMAAIWVRFLPFFSPWQFLAVGEIFHRAHNHPPEVRDDWFLINSRWRTRRWCVLVGRRVAADQFDCIWLIYY